MKNNPLYFFFAIYAVIAFFVSLIFSYIIYSLFFLFTKHSDKKAYPFTRSWGMYLLKIFFIRIKIDEKIKRYNEPVIYIVNHRSMLDIPVTAVLIPEHFRFLAKSELLKIPLLGRIIKGICITVDRNNLGNKISSYKEMKETLNKNSSVLIFPEGSRSKGNCVLQDFKNGAFKLHFETKKKLVMISLWETSYHYPTNGSFQLKPGKLFAKIEEVDTSDFKNEEDLKEFCYKKMKDNLLVLKSKV
jgi:1-acyl-sn-glycerol-3-phosphate acyltransferase